MVLRFTRRAANLEPVIKTMFLCSRVEGHVSAHLPTFKASGAGQPVSGRVAVAVAAASPSAPDTLYTTAGARVRFKNTFVKGNHSVAAASAMVFHYYSKVRSGVTGHGWGANLPVLASRCLLLRSEMGARTVLRFSVVAGRLFLIRPGTGTEASLNAALLLMCMSLRRPCAVPGGVNPSPRISATP